MKTALRSASDRRTVAEHFTAPVEFTVLFAAADDDMPATMVGRFPDGATTAWHRHTGRQLLVVLNGRARICRDGEPPVILGPWDAVLSDSGERHWHGAAEEADAEVLSLTWGETEWEEVAP